jgi:hypothetical protein
MGTSKLVRPDHLAQNLETSRSPSPIASTSSGIRIAISGTCSARTNPVRAQSPPNVPAMAPIAPPTAPYHSKNPPLTATLAPVNSPTTIRVISGRTVVRAGVAGRRSAINYPARKSRRGSHSSAKP